MTILECILWLIVFLVVALWMLAIIAYLWLPDWLYNWMEGLGRQGGKL